MRQIEDCKERRGEPVLVHSEQGAKLPKEFPGTIEWGDDKLDYMVCMEPAGARFRLRKDDFRSDPGGKRPLWERRMHEEATRAVKR